MATSFPSVIRVNPHDRDVNRKGRGDVNHVGVEQAIEQQADVS
jgi:hypothetical protein